MGGWGSGGHNKTHRQVEKQRFLRVDSFAVYDNLRYDKYTCYKDKVDIRGGCTIIRYYPHSKEAEILENGAYYPLGLSRITNIDGRSQRLYFCCPYCERRVRYLYRNRNGFYMCRKCTGLNYRSQQVSGMAEMRLKMERIVEQKLDGYGWYQDYDCIADVPAPPKPPYMRWEVYEALIAELKKLQSDYYTASYRQLAGTSLGRRFLLDYNRDMEE